jgi:hypothetical protein
MLRDVPLEVFMSFVQLATGLFCSASLSRIGGVAPWSHFKFAFPTLKLPGQPGNLRKKPV